MSPAADTPQAVPSGGSQSDIFLVDLNEDRQRILFDLQVCGVVFKCTHPFLMLWAFGFSLKIR